MRQWECACVCGRKGPPHCLLQSALAQGGAATVAAALQPFPLRVPYANTVRYDAYGEGQIHRWLTWLAWDSVGYTDVSVTLLPSPQAARPVMPPRPGRTAASMCVT